MFRLSKNLRCLPTNINKLKSTPTIKEWNVGDPWNPIKEINLQKGFETGANLGIGVGIFLGFCSGTYVYLSDAHTNASEILIIPGFTFSFAVLGFAAGGLTGFSYPISIPLCGTLLPIYCIKKYKDKKNDRNLLP